MGKRRCIALNVDGVAVRAQVRGDLSRDDLDALREIVRAVRRQVEPELKPEPLFPRAPAPRLPSEVRHG